jgi:hypothetical protein
VFPDRYEHHLHIKKYSYPRNRPWRHILVFPERSRSSNIKSKKGVDLHVKKWKLSDNASVSFNFSSLSGHV